MTYFILFVSGACIFAVGFSVGSLFTMWLFPEIMHKLVDLGYLALGPKALKGGKIKWPSPPPN